MICKQDLSQRVTPFFCCSGIPINLVSIIILENDDSFEEEYPDTRRHSFIFNTNGLKPSAAFRNKADFDVQFDILEQASASIVDTCRRFQSEGTLQARP